MTPKTKSQNIPLNHFEIEEPQLPTNQIAMTLNIEEQGIVFYKTGLRNLRTQKCNQDSLSRQTIMSKEKSNEDVEKLQRHSLTSGGHAHG